MTPPYPPLPPHPPISLTFSPPFTVLKAAPNDADALRCKTVALVQQEKFGEALVLLNLQPAIAGSLAFERAYCFYRLGRFDEVKVVYSLIPTQHLHISYMRLPSKLDGDHFRYFFTHK